MDCALWYICDLHQVNQHENMSEILILGNVLILFVNKLVSAYMVFSDYFTIQE